MSCQTTYTPTITIPTGLPGTPGNPGNNGTNGIGVLFNSTGVTYTNTGTGDQSLVHYDTTAASFAAGDVLVLNAEFTITTAFLGTLSLVFGTQVLATFTVGDGLVLPYNADLAAIPITMESNIRFTTAASQTFDCIKTIGTSPITTVKTPAANCSQNTATTKVIDVRCNSSAGATTCTSFIITCKKA